MFGSDVADAFTEAASAEFFGAAEVVDGVVRAEGSQTELHSTEMLIAKREEVGSHERERIAEVVSTGPSTWYPEEP